MKKPEPITHEGLPLFNMELDETAAAGMDFIALVKAPQLNNRFLLLMKTKRKKN